MQDKKFDLNETITSHLKRMTPEEWRDQALSEYLNCVLCGQEFQFTQFTDFATLSVEEESHCPHCKVPGSKSSYILQ